LLGIVFFKKTNVQEHAIFRGVKWKGIQQGGRGKRCVWLNTTNGRTGFWDGCHDLFDWVEWWHEEGGEKGSGGIRLGVMRKGVVKV